MRQHPADPGLGPPRSTPSRSLRPPKQAAETSRSRLAVRKVVVSVAPRAVRATSLGQTPPSITQCVAKASILRLACAGPHSRLRVLSPVVSRSASATDAAPSAPRLFHLQEPPLKVSPKKASSDWNGSSLTTGRATSGSSCSEAPLPQMPPPRLRARYSCTHACPSTPPVTHCPHTHKHTRAHAPSSSSLTPGRATSAQAGGGQGLVQRT